jgi:hypothetical protein
LPSALALSFLLFRDTGTGILLGRFNSTGCK